MKTIKVNNSLEIPDNFTGIVKLPSGTKRWYLDGNLHREDGPAIEFPDGTKKWWLNGENHREEGPCTTCKDCLKGNFVLCTKPGPAVEYADGEKRWLINGHFHREDGPAVIFYDGGKEWWLNGKEVDKKVVELHYMLKHKKELNYEDNKSK